jgi:hypothetical protein
MTHYKIPAAGSISQLEAKRHLPGWTEYREIDYQIALYYCRVPPEAFYNGSKEDKRKYWADQKAIYAALIERLRAIFPNDPAVKSHDDYRLRHSA